MNKLTKTILSLLLKYKKRGIMPFNINNGLCDEFADKVYNRFSKVIVKETNFYSKYSGHFYIYYNKKCYDAECIYGINDYRNLPIFKRRKLNE